MELLFPDEKSYAKIDELMNRSLSAKRVLVFGSTISEFHNTRWVNRLHYIPINESSFKFNKPSHEIGYKRN